MILVLGYVRVSSIDQEHGFGPEVQADKILKYAATKDLPPPTLHYESKSGESILNRVELHRVLAHSETAAEVGGEAHIIVYSLDRLTRDLIDQESVVTRCQKTGVRIHSTIEAENDTLDPAYAKDPMRQAIRQFFGIIHQLDRAIIQRRLDGGLSRKASQGGFTGGRVPFGYRASNQELEVDPEQAAAVCRVFELMDAGITKQVIAAIISREYPRICGHWTGVQVTRAARRRELYAEGIYRPRGGEQSLQRPELVILRDEFRKSLPETGILDISKLPDPIRLDGLAILLRQDQRDLMRLIRDNGILARYRGAVPLIPKPSVKRICDILREGQNTH